MGKGVLSSMEGKDSNDSFHSKSPSLCLLLADQESQLSLPLIATMDSKPLKL